MAPARTNEIVTHSMTESRPSADDEVTSLVARAARGEVVAFEALYARSAGRVYALCLRMTGDRQRAREFTHDAFVRAWERLSTFRGEAAFDTWVHRIAVNVVLAAVRGDRRREKRIGSPEDADELDSAPARPVDVESRLDLERAIASLPKRAREVLVLHDVEGYRHDEIAERLDLQPGSVRAQLHRARQLMMRMLNR